MADVGDRPWRRFRSRYPRWASVLSGAFWIGLLAGVWLFTMAAESYFFYLSIGRQPYRTSHLRIAAKKAVSTMIEPYYDWRLVNDGSLPIYDLRMSRNRLTEWRGILRRVYARGFAEPEDQVYLPAVFSFRDRRTEVDLRGRGTLFTHYKEAKPSFRVKFPKDDFFRGRRITNLIIPYDQARVVGDTTLNALARRYGLITLPTRFVILRLNGEVLGVYHEVEHFRKELAVLQFRSEGFFMSSLGQVKGGASADDHVGFARAVEAFAACVGTPCAEPEVRRVLDQFVDFERMATYAALTTLFGAKHGWGEDNLMLFFDPPRGRFEPVPWDMGTLKLRTDGDPFRQLESVKGIGSAFLRFDDFRHRRDQLVWDMIHRHRQSTLEESQRQFDHIRDALAFDTEHSRRYTRRIVSYFQQALAANFDLWFDHLSRVDLRLEQVDDGWTLVNDGAAAVRVVLADGTERMLPGRYLDQSGRLALGVDQAREYQLFHSLSGEPIEPVPGVEDLDASSAIPMPSSLAQASSPGSPAVPESPAPESGNELDLPSGVEVAVSEGAELWRFAGRVSLERDLVIPEGARAVFEPGLRITLAPDASLIIQGDLTSLGTEQESIWIGAESADQPFGVLAVLGRSHRPARVRLAHTTIYGGTEAGYRGSWFSGMFSVYDGDLVMHHSRLEQVRGEDGLNVKFGFVEARHNVIDGTFSDAVDLDFCRGVLSDNLLIGAGGDGLDFSGSLIEARDNRFVNITDKTVSAGEATTALLIDNQAEVAGTGVASKDSSWVVARPGDMVDMKIGAAVYQKKQIFGSGVLVLDSVVPGQSTDFLADPEAWVHLMADAAPEAPVEPSPKAP